MVYQRLGLDLTFKTIVNNLGDDISTIHRTAELFLRSGDVSKKTYEGNTMEEGDWGIEVFPDSHCAKQPWHHAL